MSGECGLAFEAATERLGVAACRGGRVALIEAQPARDETQRIYAHAERALQDLEASLEDLDFVAFGCGPGSFTGVRVAAAAAQAIGFALGVPVCRVSSLAVLAAGAAGAHGSALVVACLDARMERAYVGAYRVAPGTPPEPVLADAWIDPREFVLPGTDSFVAVGSGWPAHAQLIDRHRSRIASLEAGLLPDARDLLSMALGDFRAGRTVRPEDALPEYLGQVPAVTRGPQEK